MRANSGGGARGFILPTTLLVVTLLTVMLASAFVLISAEYRATDNAFASSRAVLLAQAGMENYFATGHYLTGTTDSARFTFSGGYARVLAQRVRDSVTTAPRYPALWVVRSMGYDTTTAIAGQPGGQRGVAQIAILQPGRLPARAAFTAANGIQMQGTGGNPIDGNNFGQSLTIGTSSCNGSSGPDAGYEVSVPTAGFAGTNTPDPSISPLEQLPSAAIVIDSTRIDWPALLGGQFTPDLVNALPAAGNNTYGSYYYTNDMTIPTGQRRGLLVVNGNVTLASGAHWDGIIVAGGFFDASGNFTYTVHGMIISGLSLSQGVNVQPSQVRRGGSRVLRWDYCYATASIAGQSFFLPLRNTWFDSWPVY